LAHGKAKVKTIDYGTTVEDVGADAMLLKLLARLGIERKK
jgi:hypothetical protein